MHITGPVAIITTDGHAQRTKQEVRNHVATHKGFGPVYVLHPSHPVVSHLMMTNVQDAKIQRRIIQGIKIGKTPALNHGPTKAVAWAFSAIPPLRPFQHKVEERSHPGMRQVERSRYVASGMLKAARRLRTLRRYAHNLTQTRMKLRDFIKRTIQPSKLLKNMPLRQNYCLPE